MSNSLCFFHCDLCDVEICGQLQWQQHLTGSKHFKKLVQSGSVSVLDGQLAVVGTASPLKKPHQAVDPTEDRYRCSICQVSMTGPEPYAQHIASAKHLKKCSNEALLPTIAPVTRLTDVVTPPADDEKDAEYRAKYLKDLVVVEPEQKIEDVFRKHFG